MGRNSDMNLFKDLWLLFVGRFHQIRDQRRDWRTPEAGAVDVTTIVVIVVLLIIVLLLLGRL